MQKWTNKTMAFMTLQDLLNLYISPWAYTQNPRPPITAGKAARVLKIICLPFTITAGGEIGKRERFASLNGVNAYKWRNQMNQKLPTSPFGRLLILGTLRNVLINNCTFLMGWCVFIGLTPLGLQEAILQSLSYSSTFKNSLEKYFKFIEHGMISFVLRENCSYEMCLPLG